jgi:long-subunit fatty acid transport protein
VEQAFRNAPDNMDGLPAVDTQKAAFGLNYHFPHEVRINATYARRFASNGNVNIWQTGLIYRFLTPTWKGK